ncbi:MAG TPA: SCO family protein [Paucimonas sp.]|nr:SCO family protein [Paucimonas sp.]
MRHCLLWLWLLAAGAACGQSLPAPPPPQTAFTQHLDARLPLQSVFVDDDGRRVRFADFFGRRPVVLVLGYYHCPNLCSTLMEGVLQALAAADLPRESYRLLAVSIDPAEDAPLAARRKISYEPMLGRRGGELHLLTGEPAAITALASSAGFAYAYDAALRQYIHPAGFLIATPDGRISRYFLGVRFDPQELRQALTMAADGRIGSLAERLLLLCAHYDPATGRYSLAAMTLVRIGCLLALLTLAAWAWRHRMPGGGAR